MGWTNCYIRKLLGGGEARLYLPTTCDHAHSNVQNVKYFSACNYARTNSITTAICPPQINSNDKAQRMGSKTENFCFAKAFCAGQRNWLAVKLISICCLCCLSQPRKSVTVLYLRLWPSRPQTLWKSNLSSFASILSWTINTKDKFAASFPPSGYFPLKILPKTRKIASHFLTTWNTLDYNFLQLLLLDVYWDFNFYITAFFLTGLVSRFH